MSKNDNNLIPSFVAFIYIWFMLILPNIMLIRSCGGLLGGTLNLSQYYPGSPKPVPENRFAWKLLKLRASDRPTVVAWRK